MQNENRELRMEVLQLREELSVQQATQQNQVYKALTKSNLQFEISLIELNLDYRVNYRQKPIFCYLCRALNNK